MPDNCKLLVNCLKRVCACRGDDGRHKEQTRDENDADERHQQAEEKAERHQYRRKRENRFADYRDFCECGDAERYQRQKAENEDESEERAENGFPTRSDKLCGIPHRKEVVASELLNRNFRSNRACEKEDAREAHHAYPHCHPRRVRQSFVKERRDRVEAVRTPERVRRILSSLNKQTDIYQSFVEPISEDNPGEMDSDFSSAESVADSSENIPIVKVELFHEFRLFRRLFSHRAECCFNYTTIYNICQIFLSIPFVFDFQSSIVIYLPRCEANGQLYKSILPCRRDLLVLMFRSYRDKDVPPTRSRRALPVLMQAMFQVGETSLSRCERCSL